MPIFKIQHKTNYAAIPNATLRDKRLSIESRGVLAYLLTHHDTFEISFEFLQKELGVGRDKLKNIVRELKQSGYLCLVAAHNKKGSFSGQEWFVFAESQDVDFTTQTFDRLTEKPSDVKTVRRENRQTENPSDIVLKEKLRQKKSNKEENKIEGGQFTPAPEQFQTSIRNIEILENEQPRPPRRDDLADCEAVKIYESSFNVTVGNATANEMASRIKNIAVWKALIRDKIGYADEPLSKRNNIKNWIFRAYSERLEKENGVNNGFSNGSNRTAQTAKQFESGERLNALIEDAQRFKSPQIN